MHTHLKSLSYDPIKRLQISYQYQKPKKNSTQKKTKNPYKPMKRWWKNPEPTKYFQKKKNTNDMKQIINKKKKKFLGELRNLESLPDKIRIKSRAFVDIGVGGGFTTNDYNKCSRNPTLAPPLPSPNIRKMRITWYSYQSLIFLLISATHTHLLFLQCTHVPWDAFNFKGPEFGNIDFPQRRGFGG